MSAAETISVSMASDMVHEMEEAVRTGEFASTSEVMRDAVRLWRRQRREDAERLDAIRIRVRRSLDDLRPDFDEDEVDRHLSDLHASGVEAYRGEVA